LGFWGSAQALDCCSDERDCASEVPKDDLRVDAQDVTAEAAEVAVPTRVGCVTEAMVRAIHFDDEPERRCEEIRDGVAEDDLAAEGDAEFVGGEFGPEFALGFREGATVCGCARGEQVRASGRW